MSATIRIGAAGLGRAFTMTLPAIAGDPRVQLVACADPRPEARERFVREFHGRAHETVESLCADPNVDAVYLATPHQFHAAHVAIAARNGKHVLVEKPMAITLAECESMIEAAQRAGIVLLVGHSHSYDTPVLRTRELIASGAYGRLRMITAINFTEFMYRPRRPEELDTRLGGGVVFSQAAHHVDVARLLAGGRVRSVRAQAGIWDASRRSEGAYSALLTFEEPEGAADGGAFAHLTYSGYAHFDSDELTDWIGELGHRKDSTDYGAARRSLLESAGQDEAELKRSHGFGQVGANPAPVAGHNQFGFVVASCEHADLRPLPDRVIIYGDTVKQVDPIGAPAIPRLEVIDELVGAITGTRPAVHNGEWSMATLEVCLAILESSRTGCDVTMHHQTRLPPGL